jgi:hypothetical protein
MADTVFGPVRDIFRDVAKTIVPEANALDETSWAEMEAIIERGLATRPAKIRRQLRLLVRVLNLLPILRYGKSFRSLDHERRTAFLLSVESAPFVLFRRGFWGLRTFVFMGYYNLDTVREAIGYRAHPDGWEARR